MAFLSTCHLGLWLGWQILLNLVKQTTKYHIPVPQLYVQCLNYIKTLVRLIQILVSAVAKITWEVSLIQVDKAPMTHSIQDRAIPWDKAHAPPLFCQIQLLVLLSPNTSIQHDAKPVVMHCILCTSLLSYCI